MVLKSTHLTDYKILDTIKEVRCTLTTEYCSPTPIAEKRVYTVAEAAQLLEVSTNTMYKLVKQNLFRVCKVGRDIRISKASFDKWLDTQVVH